MVFRQKPTNELAGGKRFSAASDWGDIRGRAPFFNSLLETFADVRVPAAAKFDSERRPLEPEHFAKVRFKIAPVAVGHGVQRRPVDDDGRGVAAALMRVAELGPRKPRARRRLLRDGGDQ